MITEMGDSGYIGPCIMRYSKAENLEETLSQHSKAEEYKKKCWFTMGTMATINTAEQVVVTCLVIASKECQLLPRCATHK